MRLSVIAEARNQIILKNLIIFNGIIHDNQLGPALRQHSQCWREQHFSLQQRSLPSPMMRHVTLVCNFIRLLPAQECC